MPVHRLLEIFDINKLTLVKPESWDDPFENLIMKSKGILAEVAVFDFTSFRESVYGTCWTLYKETDAMWRIYSPDKQGAKVKTTIRKLLDSLLCKVQENPEMHCFIGKVEYLNQKKLVEKLTGLEFTRNGTSIAKSLMYKREEFKHEKEVRLMYTGRAGNIFQFDINPIELFDEIVFDPRINKLLFSAYKLALREKKYKKSIRQSVLYRIPKGLISKS